MTCVKSISVTPGSITMKAGEWYYNLSAKVSPSNATCCCVTWSSSNTKVATVNSSSGYVYAKADGTAKIYATATDGSGVKGVCTVTVDSKIAVKSVSMCPKKLNINIHEIAALELTINPWNATDKSVNWKVSRNGIVELEKKDQKENIALITGIGKGEVTITATTVDGGYSASCKVVVDPREKAVVKKRNGYFSVVFAGDLEWREIGYDLSIVDDTSNEYVSATERYNFNLQNRNNYSEKQLAFLYLIDPLGIEYFLKNYSVENYGIDTDDMLRFKDDIYEIIFDKKPTRFKIKSNGERQNVTYDVEPARSKFYTDAELLFGSHVNYDLIPMLNFVVDLAIDLLGLWKPIAPFINGAKTVKLVFFSGSITGLRDNLASEFASKIVEETAEEYEKALYNWCGILINTLNNINDVIENTAKAPDERYMPIYRKVAEQNNFKVVLNSGSTDLTMEEVVSLFVKD